MFSGNVNPVDWHRTVLCLFRRKRSVINGDTNYTANDSIDVCLTRLLTFIRVKYAFASDSRCHCCANKCYRVIISFSNEIPSRFRLFRAEIVLQARADGVFAKTSRIITYGEPVSVFVLRIVNVF